MGRDDEDAGEGESGLDPLEEGEEEAGGVLLLGASGGEVGGGGSKLESPGDEATKKDPDRRP